MGTGTQAEQSFTEQEKRYLTERRLGRLATVGASGEPHVVPVGYHFDPDLEVVRIGGQLLGSRGQDRLYLRQLRAHPVAAFVVDDFVAGPTPIARGVIVKGAVRLHDSGGEVLGPDFGPGWIEIVPSWVSSWTVNTGSY
jgi:pyridoxamine 5'-phosphate oxidase family protein